MATYHKRAPVPFDMVSIHQRPPEVEDRNA